MSPNGTAVASAAPAPGAGVSQVAENSWTAYSHVWLSSSGLAWVPVQANGQASCRPAPVTCHSSSQFAPRRRRSVTGDEKPLRLIADYSWMMLGLPRRGPRRRFSLCGAARGRTGALIAV
jgi:hypothetical protein